MRNIKIILEYDGAGFNGWCCQPGQRTVEAELKKAVNAVIGEPASLKVAGRTDSGVHATGQVVNFRTKADIPVSKLPLALGGHLPKDIVVKDARVASPDFDARRSAKARIYCYQIVNGSYVPVRKRKYAWHVKSELDVRKMKSAAKRLVGTHNFKSFCREEEYNKTFLRRVDYIRFTLRSLCDQKKSRSVEITIKANSFLHNMVRTIVGTLVQVGQGKVSPCAIKEILASKDRRRAGVTAPARGLTLIKVDY